VVGLKYRWRNIRQKYICFMKKLVVLTGAGMSAESGIQTFRGSRGLWEGYDVMEVATPEAWERNPKLVLDFYNKRRENALSASPNQGHRLLAEMESEFDMEIITQNIDDLHERAGSSNVLHLHGEIRKARSTANPNLIYHLEKPTIDWGETCELGSQLRPHIVWFGEPVPMIEEAAKRVLTADVLVVIGTSMAVYPAAGLTQFAPAQTPIYLIDPNPNHEGSSRFTHIVKGAEDGVVELRKLLVG